MLGDENSKLKKGGNHFGILILRPHTSSVERNI